MLPRVSPICINGCQLDLVEVPDLSLSSEKSTDAELLELLAELCQTPPHATSISQSQSQSQFSQSSQSVGELLTSRVKQSRSVISARSLFSSDSQDEDSEDSSEEDLRDCCKEFELEQSEQLEQGNNLERKEGLEGGEELKGDKLPAGEALEGKEFDSKIEMDSGDDLFIAMETELDTRKFSSPVVKISSEPEQLQGTPQPECPQQAVQSKSDIIAIPQEMKGKRSHFRSPKSPLRCMAAADTDEESEVDLSISTPLASPIPPSPYSKALQSEIQKELDSFGSDETRRELDEFRVSQFDVSFSPLPTPSSQCHTYSEKHPELDNVWNSTTQDSSHKTQSPLRLVATEGAADVSAKPQGQNVQLEYEMTEITASHLDTPPHLLFSQLDSDAPQRSLSKGCQPLHRKGSLVKAHGIPTKLSLCKAKRQLLTKLTDGGGDSSAVTSLGKSKVFIKTKTKSKDIPQMDGVNDELLTTGNHSSSRKRKRTLGVRHVRKRRRKNNVPPKIELEGTKSVDSCSNVEDEPAVVAECAKKGEGKDVVSDTRKGQRTASGASDGRDTPSGTEGEHRTAVGTGEQLETVSNTREQKQVESGILEDSPSGVDVAPGSHEQEGKMAVESSEEDITSRLKLKLSSLPSEAHDAETSIDNGPSHGGEVEVSVDTVSEKGEASSDEFQHSREKGRRRLSLKKSADRTCRTRESQKSWSTDSIPVSAPSLKSRRLSQRLKARAFRDSLVLRLDKLPCTLTKRRWAEGSVKSAARQNIHRVVEPAKAKPSLATNKKTTRQSGSGSGDNLSSREREDRYIRRCHRRSAGQRYSPVLLQGMTYQQQFKKAIEMSKQTYVAESTPNVPNEEGERDKLEKMNMKKEGGGGDGESTWSEEQACSPLMFSPPISDIFNRTVIEESPLRDVCELGDGGGEGEKAEVANEDSENPWKLDMSISSISESPPFTRSQQKQGELNEREENDKVLHDSTLSLQLDTSFSEASSPPESSSPLTDKAAPVDILNTSLTSEEGIPVVALLHEFVSDRESHVTSTPSKAAVASQCEEPQNYHPLHVSPAFPGLERIENQFEADHPQTDSSSEYEDTSFHLAYSSENEEEMVGPSERERESPECLDFSTEKTNSAVRFALRVSPKDKEKMLSQDQSSPVQDEQPSEASETGVGVATGDGTEMFWICPALAPPNVKELYQSVSTYNLPSMCHQQPFYSCPTDVQRPL